MFRSLFGKKKDLPSVNTDGVTIKDAVVGDVFTLNGFAVQYDDCLLYTSPSPRDLSTSRMPSSA